MLAASPAFQAMIAGGDLTVDARVTIDLPGALYDDVTLAVGDLTIDASTQTDVADGTRVQSGTSSMSATFTLSGSVDPNDDSKTAAWLFGPYQTSSPLWRTTALQCPVTIDVGLYPEGAAGTPELLRKFTGYVDSVKVGADGVVTVQCYDKRNTLRGTTNTPAVVTAPPFNAGLTSEYAIDAILRAASGGAISSWPKQRPGCLFAAGFRSSLWPELGGLDGGSSIPAPTFTAGANGSALTTLDAPVNYSLAGAVGDHFTIEFWAGGAATSPFLIRVGDTGSVGVTVYCGPTTGDIEISSPGSVPSWHVAWPNVPGPHYFQFEVTWPVGSTAVALTMSRDGVQKVINTTASARPSTPWTRLQMNRNPAAPGVGTIEALQVSNEPTGAAASNAGFVPSAVIQPSLNPLTVIPATSGDPWQSIQQIASAELAVAAFDEAGIFRYVTRNNLRAGTVAKTITSIDALDIEQNLASVRNRAQVDYQAYSFAGQDIVWSLSEPTLIPKGSTVAVTAKMQTPVSAVTSTPVPLLNAVTPKLTSVYRASTDKAGANQFPGYLTMRTTQTASDTAVITITNPSSVDAWLVSSAAFTDIPVGTPLLKLSGVAVTPSDTATADAQYPPVEADGSGGAASSRWSELLVSISGNPWIQDGGTAATVAQFITQDMPTPRPDLTGVSVDPDPRLQLMDRVVISEPDVHGIVEHAVIFGSTLSLAADAVSLQIDARTVTSPGGWLLGVSGRSELASTTNL